MLIRRAADIRPSEITPESVFHGRRALLRAAGFAGAAALLAPALRADEIPGRYRRLGTLRSSPLSVRETPNRFEDITTYNNFYEFGLDKGDPAANSARFRPRPWTVTVEGEAEVVGRYTYEDIIRPHPLEERISRLRCVEAWSMVVPWVGFPLRDLLKRFRPTSKARFVAFETVVRPEEMPGQKGRTLDWPYVEGLTIAEAMHPLALMVVGVYGVELPAQNGAPLRLVVPWKYGFKSIKSIVRIRFMETRPPTTWSLAAPDEYGFYANVNPRVDHPRWSQATERRIGSALFSPKQPTLPFNGYAAQVAALYEGLDLVRNF
ncbi:MAG: protein-methionine-sulfoxide reductase catalytic subunit MsrP [Gammaproteobacteria bacterium]|nr:protein-methionine-sulfoxide reductase catalytic subunit MsrP [Gammaproteobacteria bacterium]